MKSTPIIRWWVFKLGRDAKNVEKKCESSKLGPYTLTNVRGVLYRHPVTTTNLPCGSEVTGGNERNVLIN